MSSDLQVFNEKPNSEEEYFAHIVRSTFVVGFSRKVIDSKWKGFEEVFDKFNYKSVAMWGADEIQEASESTKIIRNFKKINATVENARQFEKLLKEFGSMHSYIRSLDGLDHDVRLKKIADNFNFFGPTAANIFLYLSGEPVRHIEKK